MAFPSNVSQGPDLSLTFPGYYDLNPDVDAQYVEWRDARYEAGEDPYDMEAFREHLIGIGAPDPAEAAVSPYGDAPTGPPAEQPVYREEPQPVYPEEEPYPEEEEGPYGGPPTGDEEEEEEEGGPVYPTGPGESQIGSRIPVPGGGLVVIGWQKGEWDPETQDYRRAPKYQFVPDRAPRAPREPQAPDPSRAAAYDAAAANNLARAQSGLYDAQTNLAEAQASRIPADIEQAFAELEEKQRQFDLVTQENQARREQDAAIARQTSEQRAAEFGVTQTGYYGGAPTLAREELVSRNEREDLLARARVGDLQAQVRLREIDQAETRRQNERQFGLQESAVSGYYGAAPTLGRERQDADIAYQKGQLALQQGNQAEAKRQFDLSQQLKEKAQRDELGLAQGGLTGYYGGKSTLAREAQEFTQARDPFSATAKAQMLRGAGPEERTPAARSQQNQREYEPAYQEEPPDLYGPPPVEEEEEENEPYPRRRRPSQFEYETSYAGRVPAY